MGLSSREKRLLYLSGMVIILAVGMTRFILPAYETYAASKEAYAAVAEELERWEEERDKLTRFSDGSAELFAEFEQWRAAFPSPMANDILERQVLVKLEEHGLAPLSTSVAYKGVTDLKPVDGAVFAADKTAEAVKAEVSIAAKGSMENFLGFVGELEEESCMKIESFQIKGCGQEEPAITVLVSCYMLEGMDEME